MDPYLVEFNAKGEMKEKVYPADCQVGGPHRQPVIVITHDECTFSANNGKACAWQQSGKSFLRPKGKGKGIMALDFLFPFARLNLLRLSKSEQIQIVSQFNLSSRAAVETFEYGQNNEGY